MVKPLTPQPLNKWDTYLTLGAIPGAFWGKPRPQPNFLIRATFDSDLMLSLDKLQDKLAAVAAPSIPELAAGGLLVTPLATRFLRVSSFIYDKRSQSHVMGGGFSDREGRGLILFYFDRACTMKGMLHLTKTTDVDVRIPAAGLYWLYIDEVAPDLRRLRNADAAAGVRFVAIPAEPEP